MTKASPATRSSSVFLSAEWRYLAMLNYEVDPGVLRPFVPAGTELDAWQGRVCASMVGFLFLHTRVLGVPIPFHRNFEEVNLRFYVRREVGGELRRGVVFIKELVPRRAIAWTANTVYGENYLALPMEHSISRASSGHPTRVEYSWKMGGTSSRIAVSVAGEPLEIAEGSEEEFITEHYWGYARRSKGTTEYRVEHPRWRVWNATDSKFEGDIAGMYGRELADALTRAPVSAFLAEGSAVTVSPGIRICQGEGTPHRSGLHRGRKGD